MKRISCLVASLPFIVAMAVPILGDDAAKVPASAPDLAALIAARKAVLGVFGDEVAKAKKPEEKSALAMKVLQTAIDTKGDLAGQYALFTLAKYLAADGGDTDAVCAVVDETAKVFQIDDLAMKLDVLRRIQADAQRANDSAILNTVAGKIGDIKGTQAELAKVEDAMATLDKTPTDPAANLAVGKVYCFYKGAWEKGLPMLVLGNDPALKGLAEKELAKPTEADKQVELADGWWDVGEKLAGLARKVTRLHGGELYRSALPNLSGLVKARVEKRLAVIDDLKLGQPASATGTNVLLGKWEVKVGSAYTSIWTFNQDGTVGDGNRHAQWKTVEKSIRIDWGPGDWATFFLPLNPTSTKGDSWMGKGTVSATKQVIKKER